VASVSFIIMQLQDYTRNRSASSRAKSGEGLKLGIAIEWRSLPSAYETKGSPILEKWKKSVANELGKIDNENRRK